MINYSYDDKTNITIPNINFTSTKIINGKLKTCKSKCIYKDCL